MINPAQALIPPFTGRHQSPVDRRDFSFPDPLEIRESGNHVSVTTGEGRSWYLLPPP